jgi:hypothetical protein
MNNFLRRTFLKTAAGVAAGTLLTKGAQGASSSESSAILPQKQPQFMITPNQAWEWNKFKSEGGPTYAGSTGWKRYMDFLISKVQEFGAVDLDYVEIPYDHYIVDDWPDRRTHVYNSGVALEKLVTDGTPVPVVASYGMTSGSTPPEGITAQLLYYDPAKPPSDQDIAGKILVFQTAQYPEPPYTNQFLDNYTLTDYEWRSPGKWAPLFTPPSPSITTSALCPRRCPRRLSLFPTGLRRIAGNRCAGYQCAPAHASSLRRSEWRGLGTQQGQDLRLGGRQR